MTKIKVDIESDQNIVAAKILLKHANGITTVQDVETNSMSDKMSKVSRKRLSADDVDSAFTEKY